LFIICKKLVAVETVEMALGGANAFSMKMLKISARF
jgi:hypothetical protein